MTSMSLTAKLLAKTYHKFGEMLYPERIQQEKDKPTMFIGNHLGQKDPFVVGAHIYYLLKEQFPDVMIRSVMADDIFTRETIENEGIERLRAAFKNKLTHIVGKQAGALIIKRKSSLNPEKRSSAMLQYIQALQNGEHVMLYPMGVLSVDGRIDYTARFPLFEKKHLDAIAKTVPELMIQFVHLTYDPLTDAQVMTPSFPEHYTPEISYDYVESLRKVTTLTQLQIFSAYVKALDKELTQGNNILPKKIVQKDLWNIEQKITERGYDWFGDNFSYNPVFAYCHDQQALGFVGDSIYLHSNHLRHHSLYTKQANQIAHCDLEDSIQPIEVRRVLQ